MLLKARFNDKEEMISLDEDIGFTFYKSSKKRVNVNAIVQVFSMFLEHNYDGEWLLIGRYLSTLRRSDEWSDQERSVMGIFSKMVTCRSIQNREEDLHKELYVEKSYNKTSSKSFTRAYGQDIEEFGQRSPKFRRGTGGKASTRMYFTLLRAVLPARCVQLYDTEMDCIQHILWLCTING